jgi:hypothetical protein
MKPMRLITLEKCFIKRIERGLNLEVTTNICDGELNLKNMQLNKLETILEYYTSWKEYIDKMELQKIS